MRREPNWQLVVVSQVIEAEPGLVSQTRRLVLIGERPADFVVQAALRPGFGYAAASFLAVRRKRLTLLLPHVSQSGLVDLCDAGQGLRFAIAAVVVTSLTDLALAQTQRTPPSAYATIPTLPSAFATAPISPCVGRSFRRSDRWYASRRDGWPSYNPTSPCYSGTPYPYFSAFDPFRMPGPSTRSSLPGAASLDERAATARIEAKGYLEVSRLVQDPRGIWRGQARMKDGRPVDVILDLEGNVYSELSTLYIRIERPPLRKKNF